MIAVRHRIERLALAAELGATDTIDSTRTEPAREITARAGGSSVEYLVECTGEHVHKRGRFPDERLVQTCPLTAIPTVTGDINRGHIVKTVLQPAH